MHYYLIYKLISMISLIQIIKSLTYIKCITDKYIGRGTKATIAEIEIILPVIANTIIYTII